LIRERILAAIGPISGGGMGVSVGWGVSSWFPLPDGGNGLKELLGCMKVYKKNTIRHTVPNRK
jgi:hypothetical protein